MALSCLELWPGLGVVSRACQAGWLAMLPRGRWRGVRVQLNQRCIGVFWAENFLHFCISRAENIEDQSNAEKTLWWDDGRTLSSLPMDFHSGFPVHGWSRRILCVLLCDMCGRLPAGGPCLQEPVLGWGCRELEARGSTKIADVSFITFSGLSLYLVVRAESATWSNF